MKKSLAPQLPPESRPQTLKWRRDSRDCPRFAEHEQRDKDDTFDEIGNGDPLAVGVRVLQLARAEGKDRQPWIFSGEQPGIT